MVPHWRPPTTNLSNDCLNAFLAFSLYICGSGSLCNHRHGLVTPLGQVYSRRVRLRRCRPHRWYVPPSSHQGLDATYNPSEQLGSFAAWIQSLIGNIIAGGWFATAQSFAMGGCAILLKIITAIGAIIGAVFGATFF